MLLALIVIFNCINLFINPIQDIGFIKLNQEQSVVFRQIWSFITKVVESKSLSIKFSYHFLLFSQLQTQFILYNIFIFIFHYNMHLHNQDKECKPSGICSPPTILHCLECCRCKQKNGYHFFTLFWVLQLSFAFPPLGHFHTILWAL